jgi:uncharacterized protein (TIGR04255 family)
MPRNRYRNPPLVEAICEFQFKADSWDWTVPGLLYQELSADYPNKRENLSVQLVQSAENEIKPTPTRRLHFVRADEGAFVEVGENIVAIHHLAPYAGWEQFKPMIASAFEKYAAIAAPVGLTRIGLRYVNHLKFPGDVVDLTERMNFGPRIPTGLPRQMKALFVRVELIYPEDKGLLLLSTGSPPNGGVVLDLDFVTLEPESLVLGECLDWVEVAHTRIEEAFEASVRDSARETFGGTLPVEEAS